MGLQFVRFSHSPAHSHEDLCRVGPPVFPCQLEGDHQPFLTAKVHGKRGPSIGLEGEMRALGGGLDVLRIIVPSPDDDHILQSAGDEEEYLVDWLIN